MSFENDFNQDYDEKSKDYADKLNFRKLEEVKSKELRDLTDDDLSSIGFVKIKHEELAGLFFYEDLDGIKVYISKDNDKFELRGYKLRKEKDINSTAELLDETLTKWRLKME